MLRQHYYWPGMKKDVQDILKRCGTRQMAKSHSPPHDLYTPFPIPTTPWVDVSTDFILGLLRPQGTKIQYLLWWISFLRCLISFHVTKLMMLHTFLSCILGKWLDCVVYLD